MKFNIPSDKRMCSGIYIIRSCANESIYIGSTKCFKMRHEGHVTSLGTGNGCSKKLFNFVQEHGLHSLTFDLLECCTVDCLVERERFWITKYSNKNLLNSLLVVGDRTKDENSTDVNSLRTNLFIETLLLRKIDHITGMNFAQKGVKATRTDIVNEALAEYVSKYEKKHGEIKI